MSVVCLKQSGHRTSVTGSSWSGSGGGAAGHLLAENPPLSARGKASIIQIRSHLRLTATGRQLPEVILQRLAVPAALPPLALRVSNPKMHTTGRWGYVLCNQLLHKTDQFQGAAKAWFPTSECK